MTVEAALGVLRDAHGRVLVLRSARPPLAGLWHFPGGKLEAGEDSRSALGRELEEELGVEVRAAKPLFATHCRNRQGAALQLRAWLVESWRGRPRPAEDLEARWEAPAVLRGLPIPPPNRAFLAALLLPPLYLVTPDAAAYPAREFAARLRAALAAGAGLVQLRCDSLSQPHYEALARRVRPLCRAASALLLLNRGAAWRPHCADGLHLKSAALAGARGLLPPAPAWISASCHDQAELRAAADLGADCALLGPVRTTSTHPGTRPLGWEAFSRLARRADLPVYALGGLGARDLPRAGAAGAHGVAALRGLWPAA